MFAQSDLVCAEMGHVRCPPRRPARAGGARHSCAVSSHFTRKVFTRGPLSHSCAASRVGSFAVACAHEP
jgi:hypothetical protein